MAVHVLHSVFDYTGKVGLSFVGEIEWHLWRQAPYTGRFAFYALGLGKLTQKELNKGFASLTIFVVLKS